MNESDKAPMGAAAPLFIIRDVPGALYVFVPDPDALSEELVSRGADFSTQLGNNSDNLRGFEIRDPNGYIIYFGRPN